MERLEPIDDPPEWALKMEVLEKAIKEALHEATTGRHVDRALRCAEVLRRVLEDGEM